MQWNTLTPEVKQAIEGLPQWKRDQISEIRFRMGQAVKVTRPTGEELLPLRGGGIPVTEAMLREMIDRATGFSSYALQTEASELFLPLEGGGRLGLCGEADKRNGKICGLKSVSSAVIRIAREKQGIAESRAEQLVHGKEIASALILSPPGGGKTTFLRDLIRCVSEKGVRVSVADERGEISGGKEGRLDLGPTTDVLTGCKKAEAIPRLIRVMNPQVLAVDEIAGEDELQAVRYAAFCGIAVFATAHGESVADLMQRPLYRDVICSGAFEWGIILEQFGVTRMEGLREYVEMDRHRRSGGGIYDGWSGCRSGDWQSNPAAETDTVSAGTYAGRNGTAHATITRAV